MSDRPREQSGSDLLRQTAVRPRSLEERRRLVAESLQVGNPGNRARDLPEQADPRHDCQIELKVEAIHPYEHNPRRADNARFAEIKESIRATGIRNPLTVTRRPGEKHFIVEAGGNTRLLALRQLWTETHDPCFEKLTVLFRPWHSESHVLTAHLVENDLRGEMSFWDKANGVLALKAQLEAEQGRALSLKLLEEALRGLGFAVNTAMLAYYQFAFERLRTLGEAVANLTGLAVKTMQPRLNLLKRYAQVRAALGEEDLYSTVFEPVFQDAVERYRQSKNFNASALCSACEEALARHLGEEVAHMRSGLFALARAPQQLSETPPAPAATTPVIGSDAAAAPTLVGGPAAAGSIPTKTSPTTAAAVGAVGAPQPGDAAFSPAEKPQVQSRLIEAVRLLAVRAGIDALIRSHPALPLGYILDSLPAGAGADSSSLHQQRVWWLLAALSGQSSNADFASALNGTTEGEASNDDESRRSPGNFSPPISLNTAFVGWLVDPADETATAAWNLLTLVRAARSSITAHRGLVLPSRGGQ